jgi:glycosyltransferase involved in cell wall biosynthesis
MKVVIEGRGLTTGGGRAGALHLLPAIAKQGRHQYVAFLPDMPEYAALDSPNLRVVPRPISRNVIVREWWLNASVRKICREEKADALLCLGNFAPHYPPVPTVIRLQNAYFVYRDAGACRGLTLRERLIVKYGREHFRHLGQNVSVVVQTEVMRQRLLSQSTLSPARVIVVPDRGISFPGSREPRTYPRQDAHRTFTFLSVALCSPNKNLEVLVEAVRRLKILTERPFQCLLTIDPHQHPAARKLLAKIKREAAGDRMLNAGPLPPERLPAAYESADAFILPTLLESFGRPYDEAMHFGLPILTSDRDFARERCQDAAIYFDPLDAASVARAMARVMEDAGLRQRLVANGRRILAQAPTWDEIAARFVEVLERTARGESAIDAESRSEPENKCALVS